MDPWRGRGGVAVAVVTLLLLGVGCQGGAETVAAAQATASGGVPASGPCWAGAPTAYWVEEGDALALRVPCPTSAVPESSVTVTGLPSGALHDPERGIVAWTPGLHQAGVHRLVVQAGGGQVGVMTLGVADRFDAPSNAPIASATSHTEESGLPVFHLTVQADPKHEEYAPATVVFRGRTWQAEVKLRGNSSLEYPKSHYTVRFAKGDPFDDATTGFGHRRRLVLRSGFDDNSHLRDRLALELWNRLPAGRVKIAHASAVLYLNGAYAGIYTMADHIDGDLMAAHGLDAAGSLYKAVRPEANFHTGMNLGEVFEKKEGAGLTFDDLTALAAFVRDADETTFATQVADRLDLASYRAWYVLTTAIVATDSLNKNTYHHLQPGERWRVVPWDYNGSFGQDWATARLDAGRAPESLAEANLLLKRLAVDPILGEGTRAAFSAALQGPLRVEAVLEILDRLVGELTRAAPRDDRRWGDAYRKFHRWSGRTDFTDFTGEVEYVRSWIRERWSTLAHQLDKAPAPLIE